MNASLEHSQRIEMEMLRARLQGLRESVDEMEDLLSRYSVSTQALLESEDRFRLLVEAVADYAIFMLDPTGHIVSWNKGAQRIKGYTEEEIIGEHFSIFYPSEAKQRGHPWHILEIAARMGRYQEEGWRVRKDGSRFWANVLITALYDHNGILRGFGKVTRDMTQRKQTEEALRQSEERFRLMVEGVRDYAIFMLDPTGYIVSWNTGAQLINGYEANEIIGCHFSIFYPPEDVMGGKPERELQIAIDEGRYEEEGWRVRKDGSRFWTNVLITALYDQNGELRGFAKVTRDLTERKRAEEEREQLREREQQLAREREMRSQMEEAVRMRDTFLTIISHELRTPLTSLLGNAQLLQRRAQREGTLTERDQRSLQVIIDQATRLNNMVLLQLDISKLQMGRLQIERAPLNIVALARRVVEEVEPNLMKHTITYVGPDSPLMIEGDELRLDQVLHNLVQNAIKYSPAGGSVQVQVEQDDSIVRISVMDQGIGIPQTELPQLFQRFYRATNVDARHISGLGIGLYVVKEIVTLHGGTVDVVSEEGHGSTFAICLPLLQLESHGADLSGARTHMDRTT